MTGCSGEPSRKAVFVAAIEGKVAIKVSRPSSLSVCITKEKRKTQTWATKRIICAGCDDADSSYHAEAIEMMPQTKITEVMMIIVMTLQSSNDTNYGYLQHKCQQTGVKYEPPPLFFFIAAMNINQLTNEALMFTHSAFI